MNILGFIPARGGSKGILRKNIKLLAGKPLLQYTVEAAHGSKLARVVTSSEDDEILGLAEGLGCETVRRPEELARDSTPMLPAVLHALDHCEHKHGERFDAVFILQPTSPLRTSQDIDNCIDLLQAGGADSVLGMVQTYELHPTRFKKIVDNRLRPYFTEEVEGRRRQDVEPAYLRNCAAYLVKVESLRAGHIMGLEQCPYVMPPERSVDINDPLDFLLAEALLTRGLDWIESAKA